MPCESVRGLALKQGDYVCFVVNGGRVEPRQVSIGENTESYVEITDGLQEGEEVTLDAARRAAEYVGDLPGRGSSPDE